MAKFYTINDFRKRYSDDATCLDKIFKLRYGNVTHCPECGCETPFRRIVTRRAYQCTHCYAQYYPTAGTVFEKTRIPLSDWFFIIYLFSTTRNGVAAMEIQRQLGCTYKTAWRMGHCIRSLISGLSPEILYGLVDMDECYVGGRVTRMNKKRKAQINQDVADGKAKSRNTAGKTPVFAMVERGGFVKAWAMPDMNKGLIFSVIKQHVDKDAIVCTDESNIYDMLGKELGLIHGTVNHQKDEYRNGIICTNSIEGYFSQLKRTIRGTHIHVSAKYLQNYINECSFRYNNRKNPYGMFNTIIEQVQPALNL